jgi:hypothetical protein
MSGNHLNIIVLLANFCLVLFFIYFEDGRTEAAVRLLRTLLFVKLALLRRESPMTPAFSRTIVERHFL